ncbi:MAG: 3-isopropylmalate dehydrogenase [Firmicutes bacterium]|nr:3-isopropylmalate dehydrogenase [Bacillota bacterium]
MTKTIILLSGDGIGPEIIAEAKKALLAVAKKFKHSFNFDMRKIGGESIDAFGIPLTDDTIAVCKKADAVLLGAVGGPKWDNIDPEIRPERGLLKIRKELGLFANIRPTKLFPSLKSACPLKNDIVDSGIDFIVVRELTGGIYFGQRETKKLSDGQIWAQDTLGYSKNEIERIGHVAFEFAKTRSKKLCSIDKANVLDSSKLWRKVMEDIAKDYPSVTLSHMYVDNAAMQIIKNPAQFDVIVTENMFGDILSDEASALVGSLGLMPSSSIGTGKFGLYEPISGSAPDIAGKEIANPIGAILSAAMMLRHSFGLEEEAVAIENAVESALSKGFKTADIVSGKESPISTSEMGEKIVQEL